MDFEGVSSIGRNVARYRKAAGMSAAELADTCGHGLTRSVIANLENGRKDDVTVKQLMVLSAALEVPPVVLLADIFDPGSPSPYPLPGTGAQRVAELIQWVGAHDFRTRYPIENPATKLASETLTAVRRYMTVRSGFITDANRYNRVRNDDSKAASEERDYREQATQASAERVFEAIDDMKAAGVTVEDYVIESVHTKLAEVGLRYDPSIIYDPFAGVDIPDPF